MVKSVENEEQLIVIYYKLSINPLEDFKVSALYSADDYFFALGKLRFPNPFL